MATTAMNHSYGYMSVKNQPSTGIWLSTGTVTCAETPSTNLFEAAPVSTWLATLVKNVVSAVARMFTTTPLIT